MILTFKLLHDIIFKSSNDVLVAQLDRVTGYEPVGRGFESLQARHKSLTIFRRAFLFFLEKLIFP